MNLSTDYKLKCINGDFQVTEVPLMPHLTLKKPYEFTYIWFQKSGFTTFDILEQIKNFFKLTFDNIGHQGLKDEDAITEQLISIKKVLSGKNIATFNERHKFKDKFSQIKHIVGYGKEPIKERMLHGNSFRIVVRNLEDTLADNLLSHISDHSCHYFVNYYDNQRFGMPGGPYNTHLIGKAIVENDWKRAYEQIKVTDNIPSEVVVKTRNITDFKKIFKSLNPKKIFFFVSSYNSFLWNTQASLIVKKHTKSKYHSFENVGRLHLPVGHLFQCPHICEAEGYEFMAEKFSVQPKINKRNLIVATTMYAHNLEKDELHKNMKKITLSFFLPTGSYATMIVKQFFLRLNEK